jgi:hypothetical protein
MDFAVGNMAIIISTISIALASSVLVRMTDPRSTKVASFEVPGQQHSTNSWRRAIWKERGRNGRTRLRIQDLAKRTLFAGAAMWRGCGVTANPDLPLRA